MMNLSLKVGVFNYIALKVVQDLDLLNNLPYYIKVVECYILNIEVRLEVFVMMDFQNTVLK